MPKPYPKMYVHLREPTFDCNLPIAKCLDKNMFKDLRKKTSTFGFNLLEHIKQDTIEGNVLGWVNQDKGSVSEFSSLLTNMYKQAGIKRAESFQKVTEPDVVDKVHDNISYNITLHRNISE